MSHVFALGSCLLGGQARWLRVIVWFHIWPVLMNSFMGGFAQLLVVLFVLLVVEIRKVGVIFVRVDHRVVRSVSLGGHPFGLACFCSHFVVSFDRAVDMVALDMLAMRWIKVRSSRCF